MSPARLALLYAAVAAAELVSAAYVPASQHVLGQTSAASAILRRIATDPERGWDAHAVVEDVVQSFNADVWSVGEHHVDVYLPDGSANASAPSLAALPYADAYLPSALFEVPRTRPQSYWDLGSLTNTTFHTQYHSLEDIHTFTQELLELYPNNVKVVPIGHSAENREMFALEIFKDEHTKAKKAGFVITGAQHAREWIATSTAMFVAHALLADPSESYSMASLLSTYTFHLVLVPNPDGYVYTWGTDRLWYKNRQILGPNERCIGLDMNRNWGHKWKPRARFPAAQAAKKIPTDPCSHWYPGHRPFESPEVNNIANYVTTLPNLRGYVDLRSYGQMISSPWSYTCKKTTKDAEDQLEAALGAAAAIKTAHGTPFTAGSLCQLTYKAPGNVVDYMYGMAGIKYSYAVHLRDTGTYGFLLPPEWIRPVGEETANMIKALAGFIINKKF
ncbi:peptidase M14 [Phanerochaete sordida]|uniref:Inactive metallocarboxypeptidase ECM14 n=1 Tax=Phanerochaete sordida TaxID=48140 RepID=A0A9P3GCR9_9APHY|nr:peptidase M14 [Phanerochaete sordida]